MSNPRLRIDLAKITANARRTVALSRKHGLEVMGVTKGVAGLPEVAGAMLAGGIESLGDSRLDNVARLRSAGIRAPITLLRAPGLSEIGLAVELADASLNSDPEVLEALSAEAQMRNKHHGVILMVDLDTGREGLPPSRTRVVCRRLRSMPGIQLRGIGAYFHFASGRDLHHNALKEFVRLAQQIEKDLGKALPVRSGGSSNVFRTFEVDGYLNPGINHVRIGTAVLLGFASSLNPVTIPGLQRDTFILDVEVIEIKARPAGEAILALGRVDTDPQFLFPVNAGLKVQDATSDHLMVTADPPLRLGDWVSFRLGYPSLCRLMVSPYCQREFISAGDGHMPAGSQGPRRRHQG